MTLERPNTNLRSKVPLLRASPIIGANVLELWTIIIRLRMVWILPGNKVTEAGGDKLLVALGAQPIPAHPSRVRLTICRRTGAFDWTAVDAIDPSGRSLNDGWCGAQPRIEVYGDC